MTLPFIRTSLLAITTCSLYGHALAAPHTMTLEEGQQKTWAQPRAIKRAATADEAIVGINVVPPRGVILTAKKAGSATISIWDDSDRAEPVTQIQVLVTPSSIAARQSLGASSGAQVTAEGTKLRISGALSSLDSHASLAAALKGSDDKPTSGVIDSTTTNFDVQVQIDIKVVEVSRQKLMEAGFYHQRFSYGSNGEYLGSTGLSGPGVYGGFTKSQDGFYQFTSSSGFTPFSNAFNIFSVSDNAWAAFSALESNGFAYTLAEPSLTALSGQTATFLAGGEIPIPFRSGLDGSITVEFKPFGIRLALTPTVLDNKRVALRVAPEVSEPDASLSVQGGGYTIPGFRVRRTETTVAMSDGETFVISGLISRATTTNADKFPFLGDIPILGAFFRSNKFNKEDKELLMIATPHLVRAFSKNATLPPLPGEDARHYDPGFFHMLLKETGKFDSSNSGFSQ
ncbi:MAG: type II and III secretion system protein family protein [Aquabacterium sp.]